MTTATDGVGEAPIEIASRQTNAEFTTLHLATIAAYKTTAIDENTGATTYWDVTETRTYIDPSNPESWRGLNVKRIRQPAIGVGTDKASGTIECPD